MSTKDKIKEMIVELLDVRPEYIRDDVKLYQGIGVDSTEMVEFVIALGKQFNLKLTPREITKYSTVNEIEKLIDSKLAQAPQQ